MKKSLVTVGLVMAATAAFADLDFNAGADLRIRQELMENVAGLPGGGRLSTAERGKYRNHMRFRPRVWAEISGLTQSESYWRLYVRVTDEFRWYAHPDYPRPYAWPDELILDNLFLEAKDLFDGFVDFNIGRQDIFCLYGLDHVFADGTPADGSRTVYADMARIAFKFDEGRKLDLFALYNFDDCDIRLGTDAGHHRSLSGLGGAEPTMDDWGFGAIWSDKLAKDVPYQFFVMNKNTASYYHPKWGNRPWTRRGMVGAKVVPKLDDEWSLQLEAMGQAGVNGENQTLCGASAYSGVNWKSSRNGIKPFATLGYQFMSGSDDAADEDGGHQTWDPMWSRSALNSEMFLYGTHYGAGMWSNIHYPKFTAGLDFGRLHKLVGSMAPIFAANQDGLGGGDGMFKGFQTQVRYDFPLFTNEIRKAVFESENERGLEVFGHVVAEFFNPGDYYATAKPAWFFRWQIDFKF